MVDKWMDEDWQEKLEAQKASAQDQGFICYMSKTKDCGKEWTSEHAEALHEKLEAQKASAQDQEPKYREVVGKASHGWVLGTGLGIKTKDVYGCCEGICKHAKVDKIEELELKIKNIEEELQQYKEMKDEFEQLKATQEEVKQMREFMKVMISQSNRQLPHTMVYIFFFSSIIP
ncbi:hypothetical protein JRO89_XS13G0063700 [Xanthoceras sorbifolium]|uniref:Uncharacterized protein n=1 Tax=Xanthoceras sorbifolium TaxID=99658 RepID=A0ABQ8H6Y4_9ROSI|nr:hypothetical protein JRO89_XS13G0063700 [Xanthoceras sorbifolium]